MKKSERGVEAGCGEGGKRGRCRRGAARVEVPVEGRTEYSKEAREYFFVPQVRSVTPLGKMSSFDIW